MPIPYKAGSTFVKIILLLIFDKSKPNLPHFDGLQNGGDTYKYANEK